MNRLILFSVRRSSKDTLYRSTVWPTLIEADQPGGWNHVEDILPPIQIPKPDLNQTFPTPSGWQPPAKDLKDRNYPVRFKI